MIKTKYPFIYNNSFRRARIYSLVTNSVEAVDNSKTTIETTK